MSKGVLNHNSNGLTEQIIKAFYKVYNVLGYGFLEKVYIKALTIELEKLGIAFHVECISLDHEAQLLNYLKATKIEIGLLLNFGEKSEVKRKIFDNIRK